MLMPLPIPVECINCHRLLTHATLLPNGKYQCECGDTFEISIGIITKHEAS